jgi:hypothetical protein|tara:strand:- start:438 stop:665 length:228 start_codon:yes stop_codon:yes gene_type:complete
MKLTLKKIKQLIKEELKKLNEGEVPQEVKEKIFAQMKKDKAVPEGDTIEDADFWEVKKGRPGAVEHNGKYYYGEI